MILIFILFFLAVSAVFASTEYRHPHGILSHWFIKLVGAPWAVFARAVKLGEKLEAWKMSEKVLKNKVAVILAKLFYVR